MKLIPTAVEEWAKEFEHCKHRELNDQEVSVLMNVVFHSKDIDNDKKLRTQIEQEPNTIAHIVYNRTKSHSYNLTTSALILTELVVKNFGISTMLCAYMQYKAHKLGINTITAEIFCREIIPFGIPTDNELQRLWDLQKVKLEDRSTDFSSDNGLDYKITYESIMKIGNEENS